MRCWPNAARIMTMQAINRALDAIWKVVADANRYFAAQEPWALRKTDPARMATVLYVTAEVLAPGGHPHSALHADRGGGLLDLLAVPAGERSFAALGRGGRLRRCGPSRPAPDVPALCRAGGTGTGRLMTSSTAIAISTILASSRTWILYSLARPTLASA